MAKPEESKSLFVVHLDLAINLWNVTVHDLDWLGFDEIKTTICINGIIVQQILLH